MSESRSITRAVLRYHGGKFRLAPRIVSLFPPHRVYVELFGGAASVLMHKPKTYAEIYNDLDGEVVNVFRVLQDPAKAGRLEELLRVTPFSRAEFELSYKPARTDIEKARRTIIRSFMGFGSDSITRTKASAAGFNSRVSTMHGLMRTGFRGNSFRSGSTASVDWANFPNAIGQFTERLAGVLIEQRDAVHLIKKMDRTDTLFYIDPPYPWNTRADRTGNKSHGRETNYRHEMTDAQHEELSAVLHAIQGMAIISSYPGELYRRLYADWDLWSWSGKQFCHGGARRTELLWLNPAAAQACPLGRLF